MTRIIFCQNKSKKKKPFLPFSFDVTSKIEYACKDIYSIIILDEDFLKGKNKKILECLKEKICFIYFSKQSKNNIKLVKRHNFFDYFRCEDAKDDVVFRFESAEKYFLLKEKVKHLEEELSKRNKRIEKITVVDPLTGCYNWRYFLHRAHQELNSSRRHLHSLSFIAIDIDHFRQINELYGVKAADTVIKKLVKILKNNLRGDDILTRWREDEFFIITPHLVNADAYKTAKRIKDKIDVHKFTYRNISLTLKASFGVISFPENDIFTTRDVVGSLSKCINMAKRKGGNSIVLYSKAKFKPVVKEKDKESVEDLRGRIEKMNVVLTRDLLEMIYGFARAIQAKDSYTGKHVEYTATLAEDIANKLDLPKNVVESIKHAAVLHDLGKVGINESILSKKGPLTPKERAIIKSHPAIAGEILREIHALRGSVPAVLYHHERFDGKGYPLGLKGEEIPLGARIVAVADVYQALISDRPYRKAYSKKKALEIIKKESGKQFDSKVINVFLKIVNKAT